ncbi:MAG: aldehyde dehydrogenase (NADP(+)) [Acidimicrobiales bacterium]
MTDSTPGELEVALSAASSAATALAATRIEERAGMLRTLADRIDGASDDLVPIAVQESHLPIERLTGEVGRTTGQLRFLADVLQDGGWLEATIDTLDPSAPALRPDVRSMRIPIGPALVFAASNFPFAFSVAGGDTAAALAAGCPVILKIHPGHPQLSARVGELVRAVFGDAFATISGVDAGRAAIVDPRVKVAAFTGSTAGGRALFDLAVRREDPIPFYGELGSVNPAFVAPGAAQARAQEIASGFVGSFTLGTGQFCTKPGLLFVPKGSGLLAETIAAAEATGPAPMLGAWVSEGHAARLRELRDAPEIDVALDGGDADAGATRATVLATTLDAILGGPRHLLEECFGPTAIVVEYDDVSDLPAVGEAIGGSLTASLHAETDEVAALQPLAHALERLAGRVVWNGWTTGVRVGWAMQHGGPWPASTSAGSTSVGAASLARFLRPIAYQSAPDAALPSALRDHNELGILRRIDGVLTTADVEEGTS